MSLHIIAPMWPHFYKIEQNYCRCRKQHCSASLWSNHHVLKKSHLHAPLWKETSEGLNFLLLVSFILNSSSAIIMCRWEHPYYLHASLLLLITVRLLKKRFDMQYIHRTNKAILHHKSIMLHLTVLTIFLSSFYFPVKLKNTAGTCRVLFPTECKSWFWMYVVSFCISAILSC